MTSEQELGGFCSAPEELETGVGYLIVWLLCWLCFLCTTLSYLEKIFKCVCHVLVQNCAKCGILPRVHSVLHQRERVSTSSNALTLDLCFVRGASLQVCLGSEVEAHGREPAGVSGIWRRTALSVLGCLFLRPRAWLPPIMFPLWLCHAFPWYALLGWNALLAGCLSLCRTWKLCVYLFRYEPSCLLVLPVGDTVTALHGSPHPFRCQRNKIFLQIIFSYKGKVF